MLSFKQVQESINDSPPAPEEDEELAKSPEELRESIVGHMYGNLKLYMSESDTIKIGPEQRAKIIRKYQRLIADYEADPDIPLEVLRNKYIAVKNESADLLEGSRQLLMGRGKKQT